MRYTLIFLFPLFSAFAQLLDNTARTGYESINAQVLRSHLSVLASDSLEGRETSYAGQWKAADYIAGIFRALKLEPIGDNHSYFQHFDVELISADPQTKAIANIGGVEKEFLWGKDLVSESVHDTTVSGPIAFIGFADSEIDSTIKSKLAGKIVLLFAGRREQFGDSVHFELLRRLYAMPKDVGAAAVLIITDAEGEASLPAIERSYWFLDPGRRTMQIKGEPPLRATRTVRFFVSPATAEELLKPSGITLEKLKKEALDRGPFTPVLPENVTLTIKSRLVRETRSTENVAGLLRGTDPSLKNQTVVVSAHYDHLGKDTLGHIYHGADDNGSGTSTVLAIAGAFAKNPVKPKRSVLFITMVGEEKGLLGSQYYASHPLIPLEQTDADLNIDMIGRVDSVHGARRDTNYTYVIGSDKISPELDSLLHVADQESEKLELDYSYDDENSPEQYYRRSDHYNFAKHGIPVVFFFTGVHADYHKPTDTIDKILFDRITRIGRLIYDLAWRIANIEHPLKRKTGE